jgi:hypothetical protein
LYWGYLISTGRKKSYKLKGNEKGSTLTGSEKGKRKWMQQGAAGENTNRTKSREASEKGNEKRCGEVVRKRMRQDEDSK